MSEIANLPLDNGQKVMLQAMENMEESVLGAVLEAIEQLRKDHDPAYLKDCMDGHAKDLHGKLDKHSSDKDAKHDELSKMLDGMPDHDAIMNGVHGLLGDHI